MGEQISCVICKIKFKKRKKLQLTCSSSGYNKYQRILYPEKFKIRRKICYLKRKNAELKKAKEWRLNNKELMKKHNSYDKRKYEKYKFNKFERSYVQRHKNKFNSILGNKCELCNKNSTVIHHKTYRNLPKKNIDLYAKYLMALCEQCHCRVHSKYNLGKYKKYFLDRGDE